MSEETRNCQNCKQDFVIEAEDFVFYNKMQVPPPTFCWVCRAKRRMVFRNERALYKRKCDKTGETIFATYPADAPFPVYKQNEWFGDDWDPMEYGRDYDFDRPFFEQFKELSDVVPRPSKSMINCVNSEYSNSANNLKNCYLVFDTSGSEDSMYGTQANETKNCIDVTLNRACEQAYECFACFKSNKVFYSTHLIECSDVWFSRDLLGCTNCFGCINLKNKSYYIFNEPKTKEEYDAFMKEFQTGSYKAVQETLTKAQALFKKYPRRFAFHGRHVEDSTGEYLYGTQNVKKSFSMRGAKDMKYCQIVDTRPSEDCYDYTIWGMGAEKIYESLIVGNQVSNVRFGMQSYGSVRDSEYIEYCHSSSNMFGCISVRNKQYCIFNKQYSKEEFEALREKIINHMNDMPYIDAGGREYRYGEFFPLEFSPYGYNETIAQDYLPLTKEQVLEKNYTWKDIEPPQHQPTIEAADLPDNIDDVEDSILQEILGCAHKQQCNHGCTKAFKLLAAELQFYKRFKIPIPRLCVSCRHKERISQRNSLELYQRSCQCAGAQDDSGVYTNEGLSHNPHTDNEHCPNAFETPYAPESPEIVYCKACYNSEFV